MSTNLESAVESYVRARSLSQGSRDEHFATLRKWNRWGGGVPIEDLTRRVIREFLDWVHEHAVLDEGANPERTANKARENLRAVISWAWEQDLIESLPRFPQPRPQRDVAGLHYLAKPELNALYFATQQHSSTTGLGPSAISGSILASGTCPVLQLRSGYWNDLEIRTMP